MLYNLPCNASSTNSASPLEDRQNFCRASPRSAYIEEPDGASHQFLLTEPLQATDPQNPSSIGASQDKAKVARYARHVENAYQRANRVVEAIIGEVGTTEGVPRSNVIVVSDHGFLPFDTAVSANNCSRSRWYRAVSARR